MGKSNFSVGDTLTPTFMNGIYGSVGTGGHRHDSVDADGHAGKISLPGDVTGTLDLTNVPTIPLESKVSGTLPVANIPLISLSTGVSGTLPLTSLQNGTYLGQDVAATAAPTFVGVNSGPASSGAVALKWMKYTVDAFGMGSPPPTILLDNQDIIVFENILSVSMIRIHTNAHIIYPSHDLGGLVSGTPTTKGIVWYVQKGTYPAPHSVVIVGWQSVTENDVLQITVLYY
jgi:hypothetical protein